MRKAPISLQDLRKRLYAKAKADASWRFWGLFGHVCKQETLDAAYQLAKANNGAPGSDGLTFEAIEAEGREAFLAQIRAELVQGTYWPLRYRHKAIPKPSGSGDRVLSIPCIRDRVVQGALKLILEPIFEADFQDGSYGYRPNRSTHDAVEQVADAIAQGKTRVLDLDLHAYFDNIRHHLVLSQVAQRVNDPQVLHVVKVILQASGKKGVGQGEVLAPLLSNLYLTEVDRMLERVREVTREGAYTRLTYCRYADDLVVLVDGHPRHAGLFQAVEQRLREELGLLQVGLNEEKSRRVDVAQDESFGFLGFEFRRVRSRRGKWRPHYAPQLKKRQALLGKLKPIFRRHRSQPIQRVLEAITPILRGWVAYFAIGDASRCFGYVRRWVEKHVRRHLMRARGRPGFGWKRWSRRWLQERLGLYQDYRIRRRQQLRLKGFPA